MKRGRIEKNNIFFVIYFVIMFIWGIAFSVLVPNWQTPDEYQHLNVIGETVGSEKLEECINSDIYLEAGRISFHSNEKLDKEQWEESITKEREYTWNDVKPQALHFSVVKHLPATIGILLGLVLGLPSFWVMFLGELCSLLFYLCICALVIKITPVKRELFMIIMAIPMAMQQATSISYDAVAIPVTFLFIAYILRLKYVVEKVEWKHMICFVLLWGLITYIKLPYVFLIGLIYLVPREKINLCIGKKTINEEVIKKWHWCGYLAILFVVSIGLYFNWNNRFVQVVYGMFAEWKRGITLFWNTLVLYKKYLIESSIGMFGYLDSTITFPFAFATYVFIFGLSMFAGYTWNSSQNKSVFRSGKKEFLILWGTGIVTAVFTMMSMVNHTIMITLYGAENLDKTYPIREALYQIDFIGGLQGRYFLPFIILFFLPLPQIKKIDTKWLKAVVLFVVTVFALWSTKVLMGRYWG